MSSINTDTTPPMTRQGKPPRDLASREVTNAELVAAASFAWGPKPSTPRRVHARRSKPCDCPAPCVAEGTHRRSDYTTFSVAWQEIEGEAGWFWSDHETVGPFLTAEAAYHDACESVFDNFSQADEYDLPGW